MEFRVPAHQRIIVSFLLGLRVEGIVRILLELSVLWGGGVLGRENEESEEKLSAVNQARKKRNYQGDVVASRGRSSEQANNRCGNDVVERVPVPSVEKPNAWNSRVTNPRGGEMLVSDHGRWTFLGTFGTLEPLCILVEVLYALLIAGDAVVRSFGTGKDQICDFSSAESNSSRQHYLNIVRLLEVKKESAGVMNNANDGSVPFR